MQIKKVSMEFCCMYIRVYDFWKQNTGRYYAVEYVNDYGFFFFFFSLSDVFLVKIT